MTDKTFVKITNRNIWDELQVIKQHVVETNGKVKQHTTAIKNIQWAIGIFAGLIMTGATIWVGFFT